MDHRRPEQSGWLSATFYLPASLPSPDFLSLSSVNTLPTLSAANQVTPECVDSKEDAAGSPD
ncbi:MAG: hypothetical protein QOG23_3626 [Blastocatellia bacterium]|nr:hypothetical protein [Blastocatellia bacterium]